MILSQLCGLGYTVGFKVVSSHLLVPQIRKRVFIVAIRNDLLSPTVLTLNPITGTTFGAAETNCLPARGGFAFPRIPDLRRAVGEILESGVSDEYCISDQVWKYTKSTPYFQKFPHHKLARHDIPAGTIISSYASGKGLHSQFLEMPDGKNPRLFTPRECARLQGFPEAFKIISVAYTSQAKTNPKKKKQEKPLKTNVGLNNNLPPSEKKSWYKLIGNAVTPPVVGAIGASILCAIQHGGRR